MVTCHYQDEPGSRSICLRTLGQETFEIGGEHWTICDEARGTDCPHRGWDREVRDRVVRARISALGTCVSCGRNHDSFREGMECTVERVFASLPSPLPSYLPDGTDEPLVPPELPKFVRDIAWRRVRKLVVERDGGRCTECGRDLRPLPSWYGEVHHIVPRAFEGSDRPENLRTLCIECRGRYTDEMFSPAARNARARACCQDDREGRDR